MQNPIRDLLYRNGSHQVELTLHETGKGYRIELHEIAPHSRLLKKEDHDKADEAQCRFDEIARKKIIV